MAIEEHGITATEIQAKAPTMSPPKFTLPVAFGTAPVNMSLRAVVPVNVPVICSSFEEAKAAFGYSDDWEKFTLSEVMYSHFNLYNQSPIVLVNVLDPATAFTVVAESTKTIVKGMIALTDQGVLLNGLTVKSSDGTITYVYGIDYTVSFSDAGTAILTVKKTGSITTGTTTLKVGYNKLDTTTVDATDIIGGADAITGKRTGLALVEEIFPRFQLVPGLLLAPGYSDDPTVAAVMIAKCKNINGIFESEALLDLDASKRYSEVVAWKEANGYDDPLAIVIYPKFKYKGRVYRGSTLAAGAICTVDANNNGVPYESPSNKPVMIDTVILEDGSELYLGKDQADYLNSNGIVTAINFTGQYTLWGNRTAAFPTLTDPQRAFIPVRRMFGWVKNNIIVGYWSSVDNPMNKRLIGEVMDGLNVWFNGLTAAQYLLGGRVEFNKSENPDEDLMNGKIKFHIYMTPPSPAQEINTIVEYDVAYISALTA